MLAEEINDPLWRERVVESVLDARQPQIRGGVAEPLMHGRLVTP